MDKKKSKSSGGVVAVNFGQGSRAEIICQYFFSEFCVAERALKENDYGIDMYCTLMKKSGSIGLTSTLFGVQIKSGETPFLYKGDHLSNWLKQLNIPLLMCRVNQKDLSIKIYSTWTLNSLISSQGDFNEVSFEEQYGGSDYHKDLKMPFIQDSKATIYMGPPIITCTLKDIIENSELKNSLSKIIEEWVSFEQQNYSKRLTGLTVYFGYTKWESNKSLDNSSRVWYKPHHFSPNQSEKAVQRILESASLIALNKGIENDFVKKIAELIKENTIVPLKDLDEWNKKQIGIEE